MRMVRTGLFTSILIAILIMGTASALTENQKETMDKMDNPLSKLRYGFNHGLFVFTTWGQQNGCSEFPDWDGWIEGNIFNSPERVDCGDANAEKCAIDIWYDNTIYLGGSSGPPNSVNWNNWLKEVHGTGVSFKDNDYPWYYVEIYSCPDTPPEIDDHETDVFVCEDGTWDSKGDKGNDEFCSYDTSGEDLCWCSDEDDNFYVDESGGVHCRSSPRNSWCTVQIECSEGDLNCDGIISRDELGESIQDWLNNEISRSKLGNIIMEWSNV